MAQAKSDKEHAHIKSEKKAELYKCAVTDYWVSHAGFPKAIHPQSLHDILNWPQYAGLSISTLSHRINGKQDIHEFNASKCHFTDEEANILIDHALQEAEHSFPFTHQSLYENGHKILKCKCKIQDTPFKPLGKNWTSNFLGRYRHHISTYWSTSLHESRGCVVNTHTKGGWFKLLRQALDGEFSKGVPIDPENIGKKSQYKIVTGNCETITAMCTIMANGTSLRPTVIFKGSLLQTWWKSSNPDHNITGANIAMSEKGWTDGDIRLACTLDSRTRHYWGPSPPTLVVA
ncbi:hypothetical protein BS47DRAFT_1367146 [Hydnum rufescens UP504]|uniref:Transposase n=1 Tax=Hydnum rufescens UP504 TaxID=1448309 RepID=A0A9P6AJ92_9AGAM|nr:hypothetical protein BS47DRAFT_1367146 [Hydnum rufescens UP504]